MDAFEELYERHSAAVRRFALFLTGDPARADDLVADVFVRAWQARDRIQLPTVRAYLMTIARNLLPAYFAGEVSADTRALIDEFFAGDPKFGRMAERFRTLHSDTRHAAAAASDTARERATFDRARTRLQRRHAAMMWAAGALVALAMALFVPREGRGGFRHPGVIIGIVFAAVAAGTWVSSTGQAGRRTGAE